MFIFKSTMHAEIKRLEEANDRRATQLHDFYNMLLEQQKSQIEDLRRLIFIPKQEQSLESFEVDAVISGSDKPIEVSEAEHNRILQISREADLISSGNYDEELLN